MDSLAGLVLIDFQTDFFVNSLIDLLSRNVKEMKFIESSRNKLDQFLRILDHQVSPRFS